MTKRIQAPRLSRNERVDMLLSATVVLVRELTELTGKSEHEVFRHLQAAATLTRGKPNVVVDVFPGRIFGE